MPPTGVVLDGTPIKADASQNIRERPLIVGQQKGTTLMKTGEIFVAGKWQAPASGETYQPINPANEEALAPVGRGDERDIDLAVTAARKAFDEGPWPRMSPHERGRIVWRLGELIQQHLDEMARLESLCTGKTMFDS
ncbi:MAG TPA: aldehyde dehydrogenase family protein, partial [Gemmatimonadaceae bacterium]|nr:aldehyde dehydrogenase family protein [Gemmatimonadaceae bacterium]